MMKPTSAHPRSRGEHTPNWPNIWRRTGSPPLARGTRAGLINAPAVQRLTPARAGNTPMAADLFLWLAAHPRSRGEHTC